MRTLSLAIILGLCACVSQPATSQAGSYWYDGHFHKIKKHTYRKKKRHHRPSRKHVKTDKDPDKEWHCIDTQRGVGTQWANEGGAEEAARKDWMETVRFDHGEKYMDITFAKDYRHRCSRSSVGEVAGNVLYRCEVKARPCKAPMTAGNSR
jgi:hypothetical protein